MALEININTYKSNSSLEIPGLDYFKKQMKKSVHIIACLFIYLAGHSQSGCTDPEANNYNSSAISNDGSCTYLPTAQTVRSKGSLASYANESSGVVFFNGAIWTHNDSGNPAKVFKTDTANGSLLQTLSITNFPNNDWEDITADSNYLYIGDFGNNNGTRTDLKVLKIDKAQFLSSPLSVVNVTAQAINFSYSDQTSYTSNSNTNFDCEAMISIGNFLYLFTKDRGDYQTRVYKLSKTPGTYTITPYTSYNVNGKITGADYHAGKNEVVLIGYMSSDKNSFLYFLNDFTGDLFFSGNKRRIELGNSTDSWQTEGVAYAGTDSTELFLSCETSYTPATLYTTSKTTQGGVGIEEHSREQTRLFPNPCQDYFELSSADKIEEIKLMTLTGEVIYEKEIQSTKAKIKIETSKIVSGYYIISIKRKNGITYQKLIVNSN